MQAGVMQTHDEETQKFFKHSSVLCVLSPRYASSNLSIFKQQACFIPWSSNFSSILTHPSPIICPMISEVRGEQIQLRIM